MESAIIEKFPLFESYKKKEKFFTIVGLLFTRQITLAKAAELLEMSRDELSKVLRLMGLEYSYLTEEEAHREKLASEELYIASQKHSIIIKPRFLTENVKGVIKGSKLQEKDLDELYQGSKGVLVLKDYKLGKRE